MFVIAFPKITNMIFRIISSRTERAGQLHRAIDAQKTITPSSRCQLEWLFGDFAALNRKRRVIMALPLSPLFLGVPSLLEEDSFFKLFVDIGNHLKIIDYLNNSQGNCTVIPFCIYLGTTIFHGIRLTLSISKF